MSEHPEPSTWGRQMAFQILTRHGDVLQDDTNLNDLIDDIAARLDDARICGARNGEKPPTSTERPHAEETNE